VPLDLRVRAQHEYLLPEPSPLSLFLASQVKNAVHPAGGCWAGRPSPLRTEWRRLNSRVGTGGTVRGGGGERALRADLTSWAAAPRGRCGRAGAGGLDRSQ
jgi:hypothetical protein